MYLSHYQPIVSISFSTQEKTILLIMTDITTRVKKYCAFPTIYTDLNQSWVVSHSCLVWEKVSTDIWSTDWSISLAFLCTLAAVLHGLPPALLIVDSSNLQTKELLQLVWRLRYTCAWQPAVIPLNRTVSFCNSDRFYMIQSPCDKLLIYN